ncbi:MAG: OadG family protein [Clostridia bacterium]|nr:OadG family protein [Clostridia bacterium]MDD4048099.1 OadG family protein [Clostridia bacterium]
MLIFGLKVAAIGVGVVFGALVFLIAIINIMAKTIGTSTSEKDSLQAVGVKEETAVQKISVENEDDSEVIAVIAAAIACFSQGTMRVTTIKRIKQECVPYWNFAGRQETMKLRQFN